jgi:predicted CXXCH cytochrome family protein
LTLIQFSFDRGRTVSSEWPDCPSDDTGIAAFPQVGEGFPVRVLLDHFNFKSIARCATFCATLLLAGCDQGEPVVEASTSESPAHAVEFVGSQACAECHATESEKWLGSDHDRAMEEATVDSVLGQFDGSIIQHFEQTWRFIRDGEEFIVELEEPGRPLERLPVAYTFGVDPLQQYLVARSDGRYQALPVAWDARPSEEGGQRWLDLQPDEPITRDDPLHWERLAYNWNSQCASCHSTKLEKGYDEVNDRFDTRWSEIDVGCEGCHGPGSRHVEIYAAGAEAPSDVSGFDVSFERWNPDAWQRQSGERISSRVTERIHDAQLDVCAPCHARRSEIVATPAIGAAFLDGHRPRLLDPGLYFEDGQIRDKVYVWGSFLQSRMYSAGVRCNDCHDTHSVELRREGNALCAGCHDVTAFDVEAHHGHAIGTEGASCVACHMPETVYMQVDQRTDHSFTIPRPDRSAILAVPNACENCHSDRDAVWATAQIDSWREPGATRPPHWSDHLVAGAVARADPLRWLEIALEPSFSPLVRANAWARYAEEAAAAPPIEILRDRLRDGTSLERLALIDVVRRLEPELRASLLRPLLEDDRRAIRGAAAEALVDLPAELWRPADRAVLARALREYRTAHVANAERPEAQVSLGLLSVHYGELDAARASYQRAIELAPYFVPAHVNFADLERMQGNDAEAIVRLRRAVELAPDEVMVRYALGLALHRAGESEEGLSQLALAAQAAPDQPRLVLGWALALDAADRRAEAISVLARAVDRGAASTDIHHALVTLLRDQGELERAQTRAEGWLRSQPADPRAEGLLRELRGGR